METTPAYQELVPVFYGELARAVFVRSTLEAHDVPAFIPNENIKTMDPFATGANALDVTVVVPEERAAEASEILSGLEDEARLAGEREAEEAAGEGDAGAEDRIERERLALVGRRIRFGVLCVVTLPVAAFYAAGYLRATARSGIRPDTHGLNTLMAFVALAGTVLAVLFLVARLATA